MEPEVKSRVKSSVNEQARRVAMDLKEELTRSSEASASISWSPEPDVLYLEKNSAFASVTNHWIAVVIFG